MSESSRAESSNNQKTAGMRETELGIKPEPLKPEDFYLENGFVVFTAEYHLKRGYCCNSGCRHCPFR